MEEDAQYQRQTNYLDFAISTYRTLWRQQIELKREIDMEIDLHDSLSNATFNNTTLELTNLSFSRIQEYLKDGSFSDQINELKKKYENMKSLSSLNATKAEVKKQQVDDLTKEIRNLDKEINSLLDQIMSFDDDDLHNLRAQKQHIDLILQKK